MSQNIAVLGAGSWGTALAISLSGAGHKVKIWDKNEEHIKNMRETRENKRYLPDITLPEGLTPVDTAEEALQNVSLVVFSIPTQNFRAAAEHVKAHITKDMVIVNTAKGIETGSLMTLSAVAAECGLAGGYAALSGPSHAEEVGRRMPTTLVASAKDRTLAEFVQEVFMTDRLRVYTGSDVVGAEVGGALKNIIALGAGISDGMGFGDNAKAAMMTRGITEMSRLGLEMGAKKETFSGLTGIGDLIVTCTSMHSRNRRCGILIGEGAAPEEAVRQIGMVVEGFYTTEAAYALSRKYSVEMPITEQIYKVLKEGADVKEAVTGLMTRQKKHEEEETI